MNPFRTIDTRYQNASTSLLSDLVLKQVFGLGRIRDDPMKHMVILTFPSKLDDGVDDPIHLGVTVWIEHLACCLAIFVVIEIYF